MLEALEPVMVAAEDSRDETSELIDMAMLEATDSTEEMREVAVTPELPASVEACSMTEEMREETSPWA